MKKIMKQLNKIIISVSISIIIYVFVSNTIAIKDGIVSVNKITNIGERLAEKINLFSKFSVYRKEAYMHYLVEKRFGDIIYVIDNGHGDLIEEATSRYSTYAGYLTEFIIKNDLVDQKDKTLNMFDSHSKILEKYLLEQNYNSGFWLLIQHDINYLKIYSSQIRAI